MANWTRSESSLSVFQERPPIGAAERGLLDAVIATPDDTAPRLVYADWLLAQADEQLQARGELIVVQCQLENRHDGRLRQRERDLLDRFAHRWCVQIGLGGQDDWYGTGWDAELRRGFIEHVMLWARHLPSVARRLFTDEPVRTLVVRERDDVVMRRLPELVFLRRLSGLALIGNALGDDRLARICESPNLGALRRLRVDHNEITHRGVAAVAQRGLQELVLRNNRIGLAGATAIAQAPALEGLVELDLGWNHIGDDGALAIAESVYLTRLERVRLPGNGIGEVGQHSLVRRFGGHAVQL